MDGERHRQQRQRRVAEIVRNDPAVATVTGFTGGARVNSGQMFITLKPLARITDDDVERDFRLNALGAFRSVQLALPALKANPEVSSVVLFSSIAVTQGFTSHASIGMAKGAVEGLTLSLAAELAPKLRVNCIAPSLTQTPLAAGLTANAQMASAIAALHPLQRLGEAVDTAAPAAFPLAPHPGCTPRPPTSADAGTPTLRTKG